MRWSQSLTASKLFEINPLQRKQQIQIGHSEKSTLAWDDRLQLISYDNESKSLVTV